MFFQSEHSFGLHSIVSKYFRSVWVENENVFTPYPDYGRFYPILLVDQITDIGNKIVFTHQVLQMYDLKLNKCA